MLALRLQYFCYVFVNVWALCGMWVGGYVRCVFQGSVSCNSLITCLYSDDLDKT
jgi:hypothetical protein